MRKLFYLLLFFSVLILASCGQNRVEDKDYEQQGKCTLAKWKPKRKETFPFSVCDRIEIVTYDDSTGIDSIGIHDMSKIGNRTIITDSLGQYGFCERVRINEKQVDSLFAILFNYESLDTVVTISPCYNPRHAILFYKEKTLVEYFEICFECRGREYLRKQSSFPAFCNEQWCYLQQFFKDAGIKRSLGRNMCN